MKNQGHRRAALGRLLLIASLALSGVVAAAAPISARTSVDPNTLNPPPPDFFNASCNRTGEHILCTLAFSDPEIVDEPSGILCAGTELRFSQTRSVVGRRFYDAAGNLLQRHFRESLDGTFRNPVTGRIVLWTEHDTVIHNLAVPGDLATGTIKVSGLDTKIWLPGGGTVLTDAGTFTTDAGTGEILSSGGKHPFNDYFVNGNTSALAALCEAVD